MGRRSRRFGHINQRLVLGLRCQCVHTYRSFLEDERSVLHKGLATVFVHTGLVGILPGIETSVEVEIKSSKDEPLREQMRVPRSSEYGEGEGFASIKSKAKEHPPYASSSVEGSSQDVMVLGVPARVRSHHLMREIRNEELRSGQDRQDKNNAVNQ